MAELNATAASLLGFLHQGPKTGWDLVQAVEETIGDFWNVTRSQVYRELRSLEEMGLVEPGEVGTRDRRPYSLTSDGRAAFARWIQREPGEDVVRSPLLLTVFFGEHLDPALLDRFLTVHRLRHEQRLERYREFMELCRLNPDARFPEYALRFGIEHEEMVLRWLASLPAFSAAATAPAQPVPGGS